MTLTKTTKIVLFAFLIAAMIIPVSSIAIIDAVKVNTDTRDKTITHVKDKINKIEKKSYKHGKDKEDLKRLKIVDKWLEAKQNNNKVDMKKYSKKLHNTMPADYMKYLSPSITERAAERNSWEIINDHIPNESINNDKNSDVIIRAGSWAGECIRYCSFDFTITSEKIDYFRSGYSVNFPVPATFPNITKEFPISDTEWQDLLRSVELSAFNSLPDRIGCPGCTDVPVDWIEISVDNNTKRISYESKDYIPAIDSLRLKLANISKLVGPVINNFEGCVDAGNPIVQTWPRHCITEDGLKYVKISVDNFEECAHLGFKMIQANSQKICITKSNQYVGVIE